MSFPSSVASRKAIKDLTMGLSIDGSNIEFLYLRASCYHAVGQFKGPVKDYDAALDLDLDSIDKKRLLFTQPQSLTMSFAGLILMAILIHFSRSTGARDCIQRM